MVDKYTGGYGTSKSGPLLGAGDAKNVRRMASVWWLVGVGVCVEGYAVCLVAIARPWCGRSVGFSARAGFPSDA